VGNEAIKEIGAACQVSSSRPLQAIAAFPKKKFFSRMVGRHFDYVFAAQTVSADRRQEDRTCSVKEWKWYYRISVIGANHIRAP